MSNMHTVLYWKSFIVYLEFNHKQIMGKTFIQTKRYLEKETETLIFINATHEQSSHFKTPATPEKTLELRRGYN